MELPEHPVVTRRLQFGMKANKKKDKSDKAAAKAGSRARDSKGSSKSGKGKRSQAKQKQQQQRVRSRKLQKAREYRLKQGELKIRAKAALIKMEKDAEETKEAKKKNIATKKGATRAKSSGKKKADQEKSVQGSQPKRKCSKKETGEHKETAERKKEVTPKKRPAEKAPAKPRASKVPKTNAQPDADIKNMLKTILIRCKETGCDHTEQDFAAFDKKRFQIQPYKSRGSAVGVKIREDGAGEPSAEDSAGATRRSPPRWCHLAYFSSSKVCQHVNLALANAYVEASVANQLRSCIPFGGCLVVETFDETAGPFWNEWRTARKT